MTGAWSALAWFGVWAGFSGLAGVWGVAGLSRLVGLTWLFGVWGLVAVGWAGVTASGWPGIWVTGDKSWLVASWFWAGLSSTSAWACGLVGAVAWFWLKSTWLVWPSIVTVFCVKSARTLGLSWFWSGAWISRLVTLWLLSKVAVKTVPGKIKSASAISLIETKTWRSTSRASAMAERVSPYWTV